MHNSVGFMDGYNVYVKVDTDNRVIAVNSSAFISDYQGWILIDENVVGDRGHHAQGNYFDRPLYAEDGTHNYIYDGQCRLATDEEKAAERASWPAPEPTPTEKLQKENALLKAQVNALSEQQEFLEECLMEVGQIIYA